MNFQITPSILSANPANYADTVRQMMEAQADWIHLDVMDGQFVPPITFGADLARALTALGDVPLEAHLMTLTPESHVGAFVDAGCRRITFHAETTHHAHRLAGSLHKLGVKAGVAINPATSAESIRNVLEIADLILVMTVNPGWGGQSFIDGCLDKVRQIREWCPTIDIQVDGGIDPTNLKRAKEAGANCFVSGSFITGKQISVAMQELRAECG